MDADAVPDWFEVHFYGTTSNTATSDTDGDGYDLLTEYERDTHPNLVDAIVDGGVSQRDSATTLVLLTLLLAAPAVAADRRVGRLRSLEAGDRPQQCGLARAGRTKHGCDPA